jgi:hypothetical protein
MDDERMADVTLLGRKEVRVRAIKFVLGSRSEALREKLYEDPDLSSEVYIGEYGEAALRYLKEYCYTGKRIKSDEFLSRHSAEASRTLVEVASLAKVYGFDDLYQEIEAILRATIKAAPWFATACYDSSRFEDLSTIEQLMLRAIVRRSPSLLLDTNALKYLGQSRLRALFLDMKCSDDDKCQYLERWIELRGATPENKEFARAVASSEIFSKDFATAGNKESTRAVASADISSKDVVWSSSILPPDSKNVPSNQNLVQHSTARLEPVREIHTAEPQQSFSRAPGQSERGTTTGRIPSIPENLEVINSKVPPLKSILRNSTRIEGASLGRMLSEESPILSSCNVTLGSFLDNGGEYPKDGRSSQSAVDMNKQERKKKKKKKKHRSTRSSSKSVCFQLTSEGIVHTYSVEKGTPESMVDVKN